MALYRIGMMLRETGQALERVGCRFQGMDAFKEDSKPKVLKPVDISMVQQF